MTTRKQGEQPDLDPATVGRRLAEEFKDELICREVLIKANHRLESWHHNTRWLVVADVRLRGQLALMKCPSVETRRELVRSMQLKKPGKSEQRVELHGRARRTGSDW